MGTEEAVPAIIHLDGVTRDEDVPLVVELPAVL